MATKKNPEALGKALIDATQEASVMMQGLLQHLLGQVLTNKELDESEKMHVHANHMVCILGILNAHLDQIGDQNFAVTMRQTQALIEHERSGKSKVAGLARLQALLMPLMPLVPSHKN